MNSSGRLFRRSGFLVLPIVLISTASWTRAAELDPAAQTPTQEVKKAPEKAGNAITDSWITMKVHAQFIPEDALEGSDIDVDTNHGVVTLKGTVPTPAGRDRALAIAKATDGVKSVTNQLRISPATTDARDATRKPGEAAKDTAGTTGRVVTDGWVKSKIYAQYLTEDALDDSDVDVDVTKGAVTLNGTVRTAAGRERAEAIAKSTDGVKSVKNNLKVTAKSK
jgi:hyperosmotically inducible periplasmic protein